MTCPVICCFQIPPEIIRIAEKMHVRFPLTPRPAHLWAELKAEGLVRADAPTAALP